METFRNAAPQTWTYFEALEKTTGEADIPRYFWGRGELRRSFCIRAAQQAIHSSGVGTAPAHGISETIPTSLGRATRMARLISLRTSSTPIPSRAAMASMARRGKLLGICFHTVSLLIFLLAVVIT